MLKLKNRPYIAALSDHRKLLFPAISPLSFMFHGISVFLQPSIVLDRGYFDLLVKVLPPRLPLFTPPRLPLFTHRILIHLEKRAALQKAPRYENSIADSLGLSDCNLKQSVKSIGILLRFAPTSLYETTAQLGRFIRCKVAKLERSYI